MSFKGQAILFAVMTALFWGAYGPVLAFARSPIKPDAGGWSPFKPYMFIGVAYLVWGCVGGLLAMRYVGGDTSYSFSGTHSPAAKWGFIAGSLGAFGALSLTYAVFNAIAAKSTPALVMPIVFGGAVSVSAITGYLTLRGNPNLHVDWPPLFAGMALILVGAVLVAYYTPHVSPPKPAAQANSPTTPSPSSTDATIRS